MIKLLFSALLLSLSISAYAEEQTSKTEGETKMKIEDAAGKKNAVDGDIDQEITNKKLRAESGSKSKVSLSISANYTGGGLVKPLDEKRPNLYGRPGTQTVSSMTVGPNIRYRFTKNDSVTLGSSFGVNSPLQGDIDAGGRKKQFRVDDPSIGYSRVGKLGPLQSIIGVGASYGTSPESLKTEKVFDLAASWTLMRTYQNGFSVGVAATVQNTFYGDAAGSNRSFRISGYGQDAREDYEIGLYPMAEYEINDLFQIRTVARYTNWYHQYGDAQADRLLKLPGTQSFGLGMSLARDFYLYPNIQFDWADMQSDRTNVAVSATINVF
jgi:hypothetical protein